MDAFTLLTVVVAALGTVGLGVAILQLLRLRDIPLSLKLGAGYGLGMVAISQVISWGSLVGVSLSTASWAVVTTGLLAGSWLSLYRLAAPATQWTPAVQTRPQAPTFKDPLVLGLLALMALHFAVTLTNNLTRPTYAWDAFTTWMYRAKAWALQDAITPMAFVPDWIAEGGTSGYALYANQYPTGLSIYAALASSLSGGWSSAAASAPWTLCFVALGLSAYGSLRIAQLQPRVAMVGAYLLCSLPLLNVHASLAGYGDLWMALFSGGGLALLLVWRVKEVQQTLWLALLLLLAGTQIKSEGWLWLLLGTIFILMTWIAKRVGYRWLFAGIALLSGALWASGLTQIVLGPLGIWGISDTHLNIGAFGQYPLRPYNPAANYLNALVHQANFLLLASLYALALLASLFVKRKLAATVWVMGLLITTCQAVIFGLSSHSQYAESGTAITRLLIHFVPVAVVTMAMVWEAVTLAWQRDHPPAQSSQDRRASKKLKIGVTGASGLILALALIAPAFVLLERFESSDESDTFDYRSSDFVVVVGQTTERHAGFTFINSPIDVGVIRAQLRHPTRSFPRYLIPDVSISALGDASFYWILDGETDVQSISLSASKSSIEDLHQYPKWENEMIREFGYLVQKDTFDTSLIRGLSLQNTLSLSDMGRLWRQWLTSEQTSQRLINNTVGHADSPINKNTWLSISLIAAIILLAGLVFWAPRTRALFPVSGVIMAIWVLNGATSLVASEPFATAAQNWRQPPIPDKRSQDLLTRIKATLDAQPNMAAPVLLISTDAAAQYVTQKLPFDLLPRAAAHTATSHINQHMTVWSGTFVILGRDIAGMTSLATTLITDHPGASMKQYDDYIIISQR